MAKELLLISVGDVCVGAGAEKPLPGQVQIWTEGLDPHYWLEKVEPLLRQGDFTIANLEGVVAKRLTAIDKGDTGSGLIRMVPEAADALKQAGFSAVALANNHMMDYGEEGMLQTLANLDRVGLAHFGGGLNAHDAWKPAILEKDGVKIALLSYTSTFVPSNPAGEHTPGIATVAINTSYNVPGNVFYAPGVPPRTVTTAVRQDREKMEEAVRKAKKRADIVVVNWHWGLTRNAVRHASGFPIESCFSYVVNYQEDMGRAAIDCGADLIVGHHPHRLHGMEVYKGKLICYSMGTLTHPRSMGENYGYTSAILKAHIDRKKKKISRYTIVPLTLPAATMQPQIVPVAKAGAIIDELRELSKKYKTRFVVKGKEVAIPLP